MARCLRVPKELGESVRSALMDAGLLDPDHRIGREGDHILIPVLCDRFDGYEAENAVLAENERKITDYRELLPEDMRDSL
ncbi:MAG: class I SAM-dependent methyltransferase family protein, partial [Candidatus Methanomethylophilaceae archaeon]